MKPSPQGEIAELAHLVRPMSRRSNQIEANRSAREAAWRAVNPDREPSPQEVAAFDAWAWVKDRPNKPANLDELTWAQQVRDEIAAELRVQVDHEIESPLLEACIGKCKTAMKRSRNTANRAIYSERFQGALR